MECSLPASSVSGILQARILEWAAVLSSRGFSWARDWTQVSCIAGGFFTLWATKEALPQYKIKSLKFGRKIENDFNLKLAFWIKSSSQKTKDAWHLVLGRTFGLSLKILKVSQIRHYFKNTYVLRKRDKCWSEWYVKDEYYMSSYVYILSFLFNY